MLGLLDHQLTNHDPDRLVKRYLLSSYARFTLSIDVISTVCYEGHRDFMYRSKPSESRHE